MSAHSKTASYRRFKAAHSTLSGLEGKIAGMADEDSTRLEKLETHVAHLEHQMDELNAVVVAQVKLLERLKKEVQRQSSAMQNLELERIKDNNQKPPHYQ
jgi:uncharacterized coiled-coil protein SlyX